MNPLARTIAQLVCSVSFVVGISATELVELYYPQVELCLREGHCYYRVMSVRFTHDSLRFFYLEHKKSVAEVARIYKCSEHKINYWLHKHGISKRSISEAIYLKRNPRGDPFLFRNPSSRKDAFLYGLGIGLYWGEGNKRNRLSIRLGNTDPNLIKKFIQFLTEIYSIKTSKLRFWLQIFGDMSEKEALDFWTKTLKVNRSQFSKTTVTPSSGVGTYREKTAHGVLSVYFHNKKLRDSIVGVVENIDDVLSHMK